MREIRKKRRRKKRGVVQTHGWKKVQCRPTTDDWISPAVGAWNRWPAILKPAVGLVGLDLASHRDPRLQRLYFLIFFFMGLALVGLIFSYGSCFGSCFFVFHMAPATFRVIKFQNELTFHLGFSFESKIKF
jgi:hypothetical protein